MIKSMAPHVQVIGCQPAVSDVMRQSVAAGRVVEAPSGETLSDATAGGVEPGSITLQPCIDCVDEWLTVTEEEIADALLGMLQHESRLVEGSAACAVAAFLKTRGRWQGKHVVLIACGGNIGLEDLRSVVCGASCSSTAAAN